MTAPATVNTNDLAPATTLMPVTENLRSKLRTLSFVLLACGVVGFIGAFSVYWFGFVLAVFYFICTGITIHHTKSPEAVLKDTCCMNPNGVFSSLHTFYIVNAVGTAVGILFCLSGIYFHSRENNELDVVVAIIALLACLIGLPCSILAAQTSNKLHAAVMPLFAAKHAIVQGYSSSDNIQQGDVVMGTISSGAGGDENNNNNVIIQNNINAPYGNDHTAVQVYPAAIPVECTPAQEYGAPSYVYPQQQQQQQEENGGYLYANVQQQQVAAPTGSANNRANRV